jgi:hypothetical protein
LRAAGFAAFFAAFLATFFAAFFFTAPFFATDPLFPAPFATPLCFFRAPADLRADALLAGAALPAVFFPPDRVALLRLAADFRGAAFLA